MAEAFNTRFKRGVGQQAHPSFTRNFRKEEFLIRRRRPIQISILT